jgi:hypothetical protein
MGEYTASRFLVIVACIGTALMGLAALGMLKGG